MPATPTLTVAQSNLTRWQGRLATALAAYRQREAEAWQLYPANEEKRLRYCEREKRTCERYAAFVAQAEAHQKPAAPAPAPLVEQPVPVSWWGRLRQRWRGG
jgi:hypothetical protein